MGNKCSFEGCNEKRLKTKRSDIGSHNKKYKYCSKHLCGYYSCENSKLENDKYCKKHECGIKNCENMIKHDPIPGMVSYCRRHTCWESRCRKLRVTDYFCKDHSKCAISKCSNVRWGFNCTCCKDCEYVFSYHKKHICNVVHCYNKKKRYYDYCEQCLCKYHPECKKPCLPGKDYCEKFTICPYKNCNKYGMNDGPCVKHKWLESRERRKAHKEPPRYEEPPAYEEAIVDDDLYFSYYSEE